MDYSLPASSVHSILQERILEWIAIPFSRESSWSRDWTWVSCMAGRFFTIRVTKQAIQFSSLQFSHSVMSDIWRPHGLQHARLPCPSPTPRDCSNSRPLSWWCYPTISSSVVPFCNHECVIKKDFEIEQLFRDWEMHFTWDKKICDWILLDTISSDQWSQDIWGTSELYKIFLNFIIYCCDFMVITVNP